MSHLSHGASPRALARQRHWRPLAALLLLASVLGVAPHAHAQAGAPHPGGMGGHGMAMGGPHLDRMLDSVNATADQRAQIKQIMQAARTDLQAQRAASQSLRAQNQTLFAQPTIDARAAESLRQLMVAQHDAATKRMLQARLDISNVLTPAQRQTLAARASQRQALMLRQRAERAALDKASP